MRPRDKRGTRIRRGRWSAEVHGPVRVTMPAIRQAAGDRWSWDGSAHCLRIPIEYADDVEAALQQADRPRHRPGVLW